MPIYDMNGHLGVPTRSNWVTWDERSAAAAAGRSTFHTLGLI